MRTITAIITILILILMSGYSDDARLQKKPPVLRPVPMNPGPLGPAGYVVLLPIDDRPAVGQFAQMIGAVADHRVTMPPLELLGRFTTPGDTTRIESWLRAQDYSKVDALIVSVDMLAFGGLVASRVDRTPFEEAEKRLAFFRWFKSKYPRVPVYAFSVIMRVAPTATAETRGIHDKLARWAELKDRAPKTGDPAQTAELITLADDLGTRVTEGYLSARRRNLKLNLAMLELVRDASVDKLIFLQDDAREYGLHRQDQAVIKLKLRELKLESKVPIYNGTDEGASSLVSRAILDKFGQELKVAVIYSSEKSRQVLPPYEDHPLEFTVESQIRASGGIPVSEFDEADYRLYVNAPGTTDEEFGLFLRKMTKELKETRQIALADLLFPPPHRSGADERIIEALKNNNLFSRFAGYAAWNTAGNTLGTAIPHANMRVFFRTKLNDRPDRAARAEIAHLEFLLNRFAGDYLYHDIVRPEVNERLRREARDGTVTYELPPDLYERINREIEEKLRAQTEDFFDRYFKGITRTLAIYRGRERTVTLEGLERLRIYLPWSRTFEVVIDARFGYSM